MPKRLNTFLGFDFGMRRIGVAAGQLVSRTATPLAVIQAQDGIPKWEHIKAVIDEWQADALIVGIPYNMDGSEQEVTYAARKFSRRLENMFKLPIYLVDERLTSKAAQSILHAQGKRPNEIDSHAAALILESWLGEHHNDT